MSSLTSPSVNKNITRFTPKVKQRERRSSLKSIHLSTTERPTFSTPSFTSQPPATSSSTTTQSKETDSSTDSRTHSSTSISPTLKSFSSKSAPSIPISKPHPRRVSSTSSKTFQPPSKGQHIVVAPTLPDQDDTPTTLSTTPPQPSATTATPALQDNSTIVTHQPPPKTRKRKLPTTNSKDAAESLTTLDDITHDPAEPSLLQKPLSYFTDDLSTGVVSRSFKETERKKAANVTGSISPKETTNETTGSMDEPIMAQESPSAPQVRLVDGEIVLDTSSLYIDKPLGQRQPVDYEVVEEDSTSKRINSQTHGKQHGKHGRRWTKDETDLFYQGLTRHGTDFQMITTMIPTRTRREIKLMFSRQEKVCPWKITASIMKKPSSPQQVSQGNESTNDAVMKS